MLSLIFLRGTFTKDLHSFRSVDTPRKLINLIILELFCVVIAATFGIAWWKVWRDKVSARWWGLAASLLNLLISVGAAVLAYFFWGWHSFVDAGCALAVPAIIGVVGIVIFTLSSSVGGIDS